jgi:hypothetical protein
LADPDPITGHTRNINDSEIREQTRQPATFRVVRQDAHELVLEFETRNAPAAGAASWVDKIVNRRRLFLRHDSPLIRVEREVINTDSAAHSVLADVFNGVSLGRVKTCVAMPGTEGKITGVDRAEEQASSYVFAQEVADAWIGGVNEQGLGAGFCFDWPDVDAMQVCMYKTVGSAYHVVMRRRSVPAGGSITFRYNLLPFTGFGSFDGMNGDLAGGVLVGQRANYLEDVATAELTPEGAVPVKVFLASGTAGPVQVRWRCVRKEDGQTVLDEARTVALKVAETLALDQRIEFRGAGLYVLTVTAKGVAGQLTLEKPLEVGRTKLAYRATPRAEEKRGTRDGGIGLGPAKMNPQFKTLDPAFATPHLPLLRNHARGPVRAFFLTPADSTLGHVRELRQRADIAAEYYAITKIQIPKYELHQGELAEFRDRLRAADPQVLVTFGIDWNIGLKRKLADELLERVRAGMGVVIAVRDLARQPELQEALSQAQVLERSPFGCQAVSGPKLQCYQLGRGRVVVITCDWNPSRDAGKAMLSGWTELDVGGRREPVAELRWRGFEYSYARLADAIRWAADLDSPVVIPAVDADLDAGEVAVVVRNAGKPFAGRLTVTARSRRWEVRGGGRARIFFSLPHGESRQVVRVGQLGGGLLALEIELRDHGGKLAAFASAAAVSRGKAGLRLLSEPIWRRADQPGWCVVQYSGKYGGGQLVVDVIDRFDRVVWSRREARQAVFGPTTIDIPLKGIQPLSVYHEVVARLFERGMAIANEPDPMGKPPPLPDHPAPEGMHLVGEATSEVFFLPTKPPYADRFMLGVWGAPERDVLQMQGMLDTARRIGFELHSHSYDDRLLYATGGYKTSLVGLESRNRYGPRGAEVKLDSERLIMHPPLLPSPQAVAATKAAWQKQARSQFESGAWLCGLDDERRMSDDFDFHPQTLAGFRRWLAGRYTTIAELNRAWGSAFGDFSAVTPRRRKELGDSPNLAPWLEFRMYIGEVLGDYYTKAPAEWAREIDPRLSVGEWGIYEPDVTWPVDWRRYAPCYQFTSRYGGNQGVLEELFRSFAPATRHGQWQGYGMMAISPDRRIDPWRSLLNGGSFCWFWELRDSGWLNYAVLTSDQRPTAGYAALARDEFPDLTGGIDRLILASRFTDDKIAVAYSYPSWLCESAALAGRAKVVVEELGFQHTFMDLDDVAAGRLEKEGYRLLVIQQASCLARAQIDAVRRFVEQGGTLICLGRVGWRDLHGTPWPTGALADPLTGVRTDRATPLGRTVELRIDGQPRALYAAHQGISVDGAQVLAAADIDGRSVPVWTMRAVGRGKVFWLNSSLEAHRTVHTGGAAGERSLAQTGPDTVRRTHWAMFHRMLAEAGLPPRLRLSAGDQPVFDTETWYYQTPSGRTRLVARYLQQQVDKPLTARIDRPAHIYETRDRRYLGHTDTWQDTFPEGRMKVYALLEYRVTGVQVKVACDGYAHRQGSIVSANCRVTTDGAAADLHALRLQVLGPDGAALPAYGTVVLAPAGCAEVSLPLAWNEPLGRHTLRVTDVISGSVADATWEVTR